MDDSGERYAFGPFRVNAGEGVLLRDGQPVALPPKAFATLLALLRRQGRVVSRETLVAEVWPDTFVEDGNLTQNISVLRKVLGADDSGRPYLDTVPKRGYRFAAPVLRLDDTHAALASVPDAPASVLAQTAQLRRRTVASITVAIVVAAAIALPASRRPRGSPASAATPVRSLAVLPFRSLPPSPDDEYLGLGIADTLIARLSAVSGLTVRPIGAVARVHDGGDDAVAIARRLSVDAVLDGHVQRGGDRLRITTQLVRTIDGALVWSASFDRRFDDIFRVQDDIAEHVVAAVIGASSEPSGRRFVPRAEAYEAYMRARYFLRSRTREAVAKSIESFKAAIRLEPNYALAYAGLADAYGIGADYTAPRSTLLPLAKSAAERALQIDDDLAEAHSTIGLMKFADEWDWSGGERELTRALQLNPNLSDAYHRYGALLLVLSRLDEALRVFERGHVIDPLSLTLSSSISYTLYLMGRPEEAIAAAERTLQLDPGFSAAHTTLCSAYDSLKRFAEAVAQCEKVVAGLDIGGTLGDLAYAYARAGDPVRARTLLDRMSRLPQTAAASGNDFAPAYVALGDHERALAALEQAVAQHAERVPEIAIDPRLKPLHADPRLTALLRRMHLPQ